jgi:hypothetical protein
MISETDSSTLFEIKIEKDTQFNKQRGTIITWKKNLNDDDDDVAISFQDKDGVKEIWYDLFKSFIINPFVSHFNRKIICEIQDKIFKEDSFDCEEDEEEVLPDPTVEGLPFLAKEIGSSFMNNKANRIQDHIMADRVNPCLYLGKND